MTQILDFFRQVLTHDKEEKEKFEKKNKQNSQKQKEKTLSTDEGTVSLEENQNDSTPKDLTDEECKAEIKDRFSKIYQLKFATHISKFHNPNSKICVLADNIPDTMPGYITTTQCMEKVNKLDFSSAIASPCGKLLNERPKDNKTFLQLILEKDTETINFITDCGLHFENDVYFPLNKNIQDAKNPAATDFRVPQIYFPKENNDHILMTVLPSSIRMRAVKEYKFPRDTNGETTMTIPSKGTLAFGGKNLQNISRFNQELYSYHVLPCIPPSFDTKKLYVKKNLAPFINKNLLNAYSECTNEKQCKEIADIIINEVIDKCYIARENGLGWTDKTLLPQPLKILLDNKYEADRYSDNDIEFISNNFTRSFISKYKLTCQAKTKKELNDTDYNIVKKAMKQWLEGEE